MTDHVICPACATPNAGGDAAAAVYIDIQR